MSVRTFLRQTIDRGAEPLRRARRNARQRRAGRYCVDLRNFGQGFFAQLEWVVELLAYADEAKRTLQVRLIGPAYVTPSRGRDFFAYFFEPIVAPLELPDAAWHRVADIAQLRLPRGYDPTLTVERAHALFTNHCRLRADVAAEVDGLSREILGDAPTLGVHYRGTDKRTEADRVPYERMMRAIDAELARSPADARVFVATDEQAFLDGCLARYGTSRVASLPDYRRSTDGRPVHVDRDEGDGYRLGRDALFNCLMLSRCDRAIKTSSILSSWAKVFNPALDIRTLSRRPANHSYFPERAIADYVFEDD